MASRNSSEASTASRSRARAKKKTRGKETRDPLLLDRIADPVDLRKIEPEKLGRVVEEIRGLMLDEVSRHGGHLAPSLGVVELAVALHYCYDTPRDKLIWDVGHQAYAHKILTGRHRQFSSLRQYGGLSGFPRISESIYDTVSTGHASTSISTGLGIALARDLRKENFHVVSVIGDGSLSGGLAFEGLNNLGMHGTRMTVVVNDNRMSISRNVGALSRYLTRIITDKRFHKIKGRVWELVGKLPNVGKGIRNLVHDVDDALKHFVIPGKLFEDMGLQYFGPVDGHNVREMIEVLRFVRDSVTGPSLVHVITTKGKGYRFAEDDATKFHGVSAFSLRTGTVNGSAAKAPKYSEVFGKTLAELGKRNQDIVGITAAMPDGTGLSHFRDAFPDRFFDVGIAESHAVTFAAGLALQGLRPVVAIYSTFLQRAYDQIVHDVALDGLPVVFCVDRAGLVGDDGPTHHGMFDLSFLRTVPRMVIMAPRDENQLRHMLQTALAYREGPVCVRYPRGHGEGVPVDEKLSTFPVGQPELLRRGKGCAIVAVGTMCRQAVEIADDLGTRGCSPSVVDARFVKPLDEEFYRTLFREHTHIVTLENNTLAGGFGSAVLELLSSDTFESPPRILRVGYPDRFVDHGDLSHLRRDLHLDTPELVKKIETFLDTV